MTAFVELDQSLAQRYGAYASYRGEADAALVETYGDSPADEVDRLLDRLAGPGKTVLDLGCGAGFTLCRLAPNVEAIWGFDEEAELLAAARQRVAAMGLANATLVLGNVAQAGDVAQLPDHSFDLVFSRRGPNVTPELMEKLKPEAYVVQELAQDSFGLKEIFGRQPFLPQTGDNPHWLVYNYSWLGLFPVSIKEYYYEEFFRDADHLASYLSREYPLSDWTMPPMPYEEQRDRAALELYARYNTTSKGIRLLSHRKVYLFRRAAMNYFPVAPEIKPLYNPVWG